MVKLIVAVGNPGKTYMFSRHNLGFLLADKLIELLQGPSFKPISKCFSSVAIVETPEDRLVFIKPDTFVNLSGKAVLAAKKIFNVDLKHLLVLADDVNLPFGKTRLRYQAGSGGHKGIKSIVSSLGTNDFWQLRLGVGRPMDETSGLSDFVLGSFSPEEKVLLNPFFSEASALFFQWCSESQIV